MDENLVTYWLIFLLCGLLALAEETKSTVSAKGLGWLVFALLLVFIGYRDTVGADWGAYLNQLSNAKNFELFDIKVTSDPAYLALTWLGANVFGGIYLPNLVCAAIFLFGLAKFAAANYRPWLIITVAFPYLVVVVAMGYTRQATALGLAMAALVAFKQDQLFRFVILICLAAFFHKSAAIFLGALVLSPNIKIAVKIALGVFLVVLIPTLILQAAITDRYATLLTSGRESSGVYLRVAMNAIAGTIFLFTLRYFNLRGAEYRLWLASACLALLFIPLLFVSPSTTVVDRLALYLLPLQLFVWGRIPEVLGGDGPNNRLYTVSVIVYSAAILFVWLNFANNAGNWLPYKFHPWESFWRQVYG